MNIRNPIRAGMFYESSPTSCRHHAERLVEAAEVPADLPSPRYGGLVPHAGWPYSGALAARTLKALLPDGRKTVVLFGADHSGVVRRGEIYDSGVWLTPLGETKIDEDLAGQLLGIHGFRANPQAHAHEHSLEVQVPLIQVLAPEVMILPIAVPPTDEAVAIGRAVGQALARRGEEVCVVGSTDLTHHAGHFPAPGGRGAAGEKWTRLNDRRMLDLIEAMNADAVVPEAHSRMNACGAGAIAATVAACLAMGAQRGICLDYTNSYLIVHARYPDEPDDTTVGYASVIFA